MSSLNILILFATLCHLYRGDRSEKVLISDKIPHIRLKSHDKIATVELNTEDLCNLNSRHREFTMKAVTKYH